MGRSGALVPPLDVVLRLNPDTGCEQRHDEPSYEGQEVCESERPVVPGHCALLPRGSCPELPVHLQRSCPREARH